MSRNYPEFAKHFETCDIDAEDFSHRDHVGVAHELLRKYDFLAAVQVYSRCINTIATNAGAATKFNTTITLAFLSIIAERMAVTEHSSFDRFLDENPDLMNRELLSKWYSRERLQSDSARTSFLMPDLAVSAS